MSSPSHRPVALTRRVSFSSGHRYWLEALTAAQNRELYGPWASRYNHGHNYVLDVTVDGLVEPETGMVVNIKTIDEVLKDQVVSRFDGRSINDEVKPFATTSPTLENLLLFIRGELQSENVLPPAVRLVGLRLEESPLIYGELRRNDQGWSMTFTRVYEFSASHRLHVPSYSPEQNVELFGKCNNEAGHGHNYFVEVTVEGEPSPQTGMMVDLGELDRVVNDLVVERYDHKNFNVDLPEFAHVVPTSEIIVETIFNALKGKLPAKLKRVRLQETARNIFEVVAD